MRENHALHKMRAGEPAIGAAVGLGAPLAAELLSLAGFDFVLVDGQHGIWDDQSMMAAFRSICLGSAVPMARVSENNYYSIGRLLDRGLLGVVVPLVNSPEEAAAAARAVRYPPAGQRSIGPTGTLIHGEDYVARVNDEVFLAVQIESQTAVERAEEILSVDGVDGCWVGPGDLGLSMGVDLSTPEGVRAHREAILRVRDVCLRLNKIPGIAAGPASAQQWLEEGFLFVTAVSDFSLVVDGAPKVLGALRDVRA